MKLSFSTLACPDFSWIEIYSMAKDFGLDGIEIRGLGDDLYAVNAGPFTPSKIDATIKKLEELNAKAVNSKLGDVMNNSKNVSGVDIVTSQVDGLAVNDLRTLCDSIRDKMECGVAVLASNNEDKLMFIAMATKSALEKGVHAGNIIREITKIAGGSGGGKPDMAQGGGKDVTKVADALAAVEGIIESQVK